MLPLKMLIQVVLPLLILAGVFMAGRLSATTRAITPSPTFHAGLSIDRLNQLAELLVIRLDVTDVVITSVRGRTGGVQVVLLVTGDVSLGIDVSTTRFANIDQVHRTAMLIVPPPTPSRPRLDHSRTQILLLQKDGLWQCSPGARSYAVITDRAMAEAQTLINMAGSTAEADSKARTHAESILHTFFRSIDWMVEIRWSDAKSASDAS